MSYEAVHRLTDRAKRAIVQLEKEFRQRAKNLEFARYAGIPIAGGYAALSKEYEQRLGEIIRDGTEETTVDRYVHIQCPSCGRESNIAGDVERWTCSCSPIERWAFQTYKD